MTGKHEAPEPTPGARPETAPTPESHGGAASDAPAAGEAAAGEAAAGEAAAGEQAAGSAGDDSPPGGSVDGAGDSVDGDSESGQEPIDLSEIESFLSVSDGLKGIVAERDEYLDSLRRLQADFDNYRKRAIRQQTELVERATEGLLLRLLPVLDALDLAMAHLPAAGGGGDSDAMKSLTQIGTLLRDVLEREGLERIDKVGVRFDPTIHDAVAQAGPSDEPENGEPEEGSADQGAGGTGDNEQAGSGTSGSNSVASVMRSGYRLKGRVLRPAMVAVRS